MVPIHLIQGRLSNQMFILAAHYTRCRDENIHFFVQDEKYFEKYKEDIKRIFGGGIAPRSIERVAIHRRLTDYVGNSFYVDLGHHEHEKLEENYFMRAMAEFPEGTEFTVFSDDINTALKEPMFRGEQFEFARFGKNQAGELLDCQDSCHTDSRSKLCDYCLKWCRPSAEEDMNAIASHIGIIGSNSSFSWWAAYLSEADKIIFPKQWFSNPADDQFIGIPSTWQRL